MLEFLAGDFVTWESNGLKKKGQVVAVVPGGEISKLSIPKDINASVEFATEGVRKEDSYLVLVDRGEGKKPGLYWPLTGLLKKRLSVSPKPSTNGHANGKLDLGDEGPLHKLTQRYFEHQAVIQEAEGVLHEIGDSIAEAMTKEGRSEIRCDKGGKPYLFKVVHGKDRLRVTRAKKESIPGRSDEDVPKGGVN